MQKINDILKKINCDSQELNAQKNALRKYLIQKRFNLFNYFKDKEKWGENQFFQLIKNFKLKNENELEQHFDFIACFYPIRAELNFLKFVKENWIFPKIKPNSKDLAWFPYGNGTTDYIKNKFNIPERADKYTINISQTAKILCLMPGLAADVQNNRLGYGGGYYDWFLKKHKNVTSVLCLPSDEFLFDQLPIHEHDTKVDLVIH